MVNKFSILLQLLFFFVFKSKKIRQSEQLFFFPFYHIGGAEKVHLQIVTAVSSSKNHVFFTKQSTNESLKRSFKQVSDCSTIFYFIRHEGIIKRLFVKRFCSLINSSTKLKTVLGCNTEFYYDILKHLRPSIHKIDLTHAFSFPDYGLEHYSLPYISYLNTRVVINTITLENYRTLYFTNGIDEGLLNAFIVIENGIYIDEANTNYKSSKTFNVGYIGRWSPEKRPELYLEVAKNVGSLHSNINFLMAGTNMGAFKDLISSIGIDYKGVLNKAEDLNLFYINLNVLVITSYREGLPLVLMEAMSHGVIVIATNVGSIHEHIENGINGFLIDNYVDTKLIQQAISEKIVDLYMDQDLRKKMSLNAFRYAKTHFGMDNFNKAYRKILTHV
ncbi:glycosyltransferase involved in cell wall biosynthesis [Flavobacteriaceae bacterium MAR_2010_105]|nr:glycosyltransferase involved in cell wall biosynthesis [Flavobacteriaceae bacterium MAR_2010_105]